jgi:glutathione synthase/RimK-type ligase-like ATP-grasp enzyme
MILVCGGLADSVTELVCARLRDCGYPYRLLDLGVYPTGFEIKWHWRGSGPGGYIAGPDWRLDLDDLTGVYARFLGPEGRVPPPDTAPEVAPAMYAEYDTGLMALLEDLTCAVVNRLGGGMSNHSKAYQALLVRRSGLLIPSALVTNDPEAALSFYEECQGEVIYKSLSGVRSIVRRMGAEQFARLSLLRHGPALFQAFVPGENVRVHTVGDQVFATRVYSEAVDYRYATREGRTVEMEPTVLPQDVTAACLRLARRLDLLLTGIDLKETPEGDYYCFEVNPSPGFLYYEQSSGQPISAALASLLHHGLSPGVQQREENADAMNMATVPKARPD